MHGCFQKSLRDCFNTCMDCWHNVNMSVLNQPPDRKLDQPITMCDKQSYTVLCGDLEGVGSSTNCCN